MSRLDYMRSWREANRQTLTEYHRNWRNNKKEKCKEIHDKYYDNKKCLEPTWVRDKTRMYRFKRKNPLS